jgi:hypothetical protein
MSTHKRTKRYLPTAEQIHRECALIQRTWSERQRRNRQARRNAPVEIPLYSAISLSESGLVGDEADRPLVE